MSFEDPRGSLALPRMQVHQLAPKLQQNRRSFPQLPRAKLHRPKKLPCYDWIFSSATNVHVAIDKYWFKSFTPFDTHVLTVAGQRPVSIRGIGSVDLKIRCKQGGHQSRVIHLENVLFVPSWTCNIFSDVYFDSSSEHEFEHKWTQQGISFTKKMGGKLKSWGYTESFCGLDRFALSRKPHGRSPMQEDKEREVWSVNLNWPQSQRDKWDEMVAKELRQLAKEHEVEILAQQQKAEQKAAVESTQLLLSKNTDPGKPNPKLKSTSPPPSASKVSVKSRSEKNLASVIARQVSAVSLDLEQAGARMSLNEISSNKTVTIKADPENRVGSLKASVNASRGLIKDFLAARTEDKENKPRTASSGGL
ncbi:hypothetical protein LTR70_003082 [Exophiala xenobiotica]|uniref:Retrovirus-related Pol polyprotein from transposon TNT 1-94-like beta-barrel domain-containing protein n=1 Tax=Lithohypha guttulata TaxID=1690604 RepID=A0ABR0KIY9_9EURO|nr:hypothetical protein LTR24_002685 [Lithohypha guttulata]KAK5323793.1 hypothetical protein LTR70_003082 [Exophiala xenobiotica]